MRKIERISIGGADRERLERLVRDRNTPQKVVWRARIVLLANNGLTAEAIAAAVGKSLLTVRRWRRRHMAEGIEGLLKDATRLCVDEKSQIQALDRTQPGLPMKKS